MELKKKHLLGILGYIIALLLCVTGLRSCDSSVKLPSFDSNLISSVNTKAKAVDDLIDGIKTPITLESAGAISAARAAYDALSDTDKPHVSLLDKLKGYEDALSDLGGGLLASNAVDLDNLLSGIKLPLSNDDKAKLPELRAAYDALSADEKAKFKGLNLLEGLELANGGAKGLDDLLKGIKLPLNSNDGDLLSKIGAAFDALGDDEKAKFKGLNLLEGLKLSLNGASGLNDLLNGISTPITIDDADTIARIRAGFNALNDDEKAKFDSLDKLERFELDLKNFGIGNPNAVVDLIKNIPTPITLDSEDAINKALNAYNDLNDNEKDGVTNYDLLQDYLNQLNNLKNSDASNNTGSNNNTSGNSGTSGANTPKTGVE